VADHRALAGEQRRVQEMEESVRELSYINEGLISDLEEAKQALADLLAESGDSVQADSIAAQVTAVKSKVTDLQSQTRKSSRMVEELEEQLAQNFDEAQATNNRLSTLQSERHAQLEEALQSRIKAQSDLDVLREEYATLLVSRIPA
jgi:kinesin family protein 4/21/27